MLIDGFARDFRRFGLGKALRKTTYILINKVVHLDVLYVSLFDAREPAAQAIEMPGRYRFDTLDEAQTIAFGEDNPESATSPQFVRAALAEGHACFGLFDGEKVITAIWVSSGSVVIARGQTIHFADTCIYGYKAYTLPDYRGQKLFTYCKIGIARHFLKQGFFYQFGIIDAFNYASRGASDSIGEREVARISVLRIFGRSFVHHGRGARTYGLRLVVDS